ncbi:FERM, ARHGEF and pleckstrin domain-containing protein 2 isoform X4 [Mauremys reevesii]|uniref:FERM, ARHGEF and pleckstrin domain-containing protein 2 isoform X4 n=1 Tax=Mauremys reevesii TaxID=260615 RepID=UPI00193EF6D2|nr:FERM, ARHGEF and pleckstrin domain-containing protein 2 isoform X4 [Mauremys reevesii]
MGEIEGTYRILQTPGSRLGVQKNTGVSTLEPEQNLSTAMAMTPAKMHERDLPIKIKLLDNTVEVLNVESKCYGQTLLTEVYKHLNLVESDYFGIEFQNIQSYWIWLEPMKPIFKQVRRPKNTVLRLAVKFFPPDPGQLQEEYTRYLFALQIKRDLAEERLTCSDNTAALIISHLLQSEIGDFDESGDRDHLKTNQYLPNQERVQGKILEFHRKHLRGQTPAESDFQVLEIARKLEMYGVRFHLASDREGSKISLAVSHMGVLVFQGTTKINTFNWSKVRKLSFKRKRFLIKLHPEVHGPYQDTLEFLFGSRDECKNFWKICVEYHTFFRLFDQPKPKAKAVFFSRGSSFRYSGRTQKQLVDYVKDSGMKKTPYERRHSKARVSAHTSNTDVPKQSVSFTEGLGAPGSHASVSASFPSVYTSSTTTTDVPICMETNHSFLDSRAPYMRSPTTEKSIAVPTEETGKKATQQPGSPILQSLQGVGFCNVVGNCSPTYTGVESSCGLDLEIEKVNQESRVIFKNDNDEDDFTTGVFIADKKHQYCGRGDPLFTLTNSQLQVSEEFIDDDPTEISFFAGGSEAFSYVYSGLDQMGSDLSRHASNSTKLTKDVLQQSMVSSQSSPDRYSIEAVDMNMEDEFEFEGSDFNGNERPSDTSELFEVKAQASRMQSLLSPSETSSLINNRSESSSLNNLPLNGASSFHTYNSANHSEASSMVNFPAYSVRSESSSAFQFTDIIDQLEQLSYPLTTTEDSTSTDTDSWDSESATPMDGNHFFSNPFAQATGLSMDHLQLSSFTLKSPQSLNPTFQVNLNPASQGSSPLLSPVLSDAGSARVEEEVKRKRYPTEKVYFIAKEILATERTYVKDLEVITVWFRSAVIKENAMPEGLMTLLFSNIDPIYEFHRSFLKEMEQRVALWEGQSNSHVKGDYQRIGDVMLRNMCMLKEFTSYLQKHDEVLTELEKATKHLKKLEMVYKEFELQKVCYLPLNTFLLKPIQRLIHYKLILGRLCKHYTVEHQDYADCRNALKEVTEMTSQLQNSLIRLENFQKLTELQHDLIGIDNLIAPGRFSDMLLYTSKGVTGTNQFKIHGHLPLHGMLVEESENEWSVPHCFTIYSAQKTIVVAASTHLEMRKWMEDLNMAIEMAKKSSEKYDTFLESSMCNRSNRSSDEVSLEQESEDDIQSSRSSLDRQSHHRANTTMHVCWYRNTSVSMTDHSVAVENQLSGYLLRKFKNSNGWQKLWVVFTNFCLFFYKTHQDDYPLASLPLLGYTVSTPVEADGIQKDYVFKLQFKSHVYFFRAESKYTFERWMEVIKRATNSPGRSSLLIPMDEKDVHTN